MIALIGALSALNAKCVSYLQLYVSVAAAHHLLLWEVGSGGCCYQSLASGIGFRSVLDSDENTNMHCVLTNTHKQGLFVA